MIRDGKKELSVGAALRQKLLHLLLIEGVVFGVNLLNGLKMGIGVMAALAVGIAVVFIGVYVVLWIDDTINAEKFNAKLKELQQQEKDR